MSVDESIARAKEAAAKLPHVNGDVSELLRADAVAFCERLPEPPLYRRHDDPVRAQASALIGEGEGLLARAYQSKDPAWTPALEAWLTTLHHIAAGRVAHSERSWAEARRLEQAASGRRRLYVASDERRPAVFDKDTRQSRFDPRPERSVSAKLPCPQCRKVAEWSFSPRVAMNQLTCTSCTAAWWAYFAEVRSVELHRRGAQRRVYDFRLSELGGAQTRVEVEDASTGELQVAKNDLLAFLYLPRATLRGVLNLSSSRVLWVTRGGPCFVATVAFGEGAPELEVLRAFRDERLLPSRLGRQLVAAYYRHGPALARTVMRSARLQAATRAGLTFVVRALESRDV
jgi:hypothetical protein